MMASRTSEERGIRETRGLRTGPGCFYQTHILDI